VRLAVGTLGVLIFTFPVLANPFCDAYFGSNVVPETADCHRSLSETGAKQLHCKWGFEYRDKAARRFFESLIADVADCLGPKAVRGNDLGVNHPDSYDLRIFRLKGLEYAVSLKDKGALQQTFVFLRVPQR
jgi:hypothetical protein